MKNPKNGYEMYDCIHYFADAPEAELCKIPTDIWTEAVTTNLSVLKEMPDSVLYRLHYEEVKAIYRAFMLAENDYIAVTLQQYLEELYKTYPPRLIFEAVLEVGDRVDVMHSILLMSNCSSWNDFINKIFPDKSKVTLWQWKKYIFIYPPLYGILRELKVPLAFHHNTENAIETRIEMYKRRIK